MRASYRTVLRVAGAFILAVGVLGTVILLSVDPCVVRCAFTEPFGWLTPLVAASVLGGATFVLLGQRRPRSTAASVSGLTPCGSCGRGLLGEWRMCPYCGEVLEISASTSRAARQETA